MKEIKKGDKVKLRFIELTIEKVVSAHNYKNYGSEQDNWYIEFFDTNGQFHYWKQQYDGGELVSC